MTEEWKSYLLCLQRTDYCHKPVSKIVAKGCRCRCLLQWEDFACSYQLQRKLSFKKFPTKVIRNHDASMSNDAESFPPNCFRALLAPSQPDPVLSQEHHNATLNWRKCKVRVSNRYPPHCWVKPNPLDRRPSHQLSASKMSLAATTPSKGESQRCIKIQKKRERTRMRSLGIWIKAGGGRSH